MGGLKIAPRRTIRKVWLFCTVSILLEKIADGYLCVQHTQLHSMQLPRSSCRGAVLFSAIYFFGTKKLQVVKHREAHHTQRKTQLKSIQFHEARIRNFTP